MASSLSRASGAGPAARKATSSLAGSMPEHFSKGLRAMTSLNSGAVRRMTGGRKANWRSMASSIFFVSPVRVLRPEGGRDFLHKPVRLPAAVEAVENHCIAADLAHQVGQQRFRQPSAGGQVCAVLADDARQSAQVPSAGHHRSYHEAPPVHVTPAAPVWVSA